MITQKGQTLLEILLAFSVAILVLGAVIIAIATSLNNVQYAKNQGLANSYAQEGMAAVRQLGGSKGSGSYCLSQDLSNLPDYDNNNCAAVGKVGIFVRKVDIAHDSSNCCSNNDAVCTGGLKGSRVIVKVSWTDSKCPAGAGNPYCHNTELITCLSKIDPKSMP